MEIRSGKIKKLKPLLLVANKDFFLIVPVLILSDVQTNAITGEVNLTHFEYSIYFS